MDIKFSDLTYTVKDALFNKSELKIKKIVIFVRP